MSTKTEYKATLKRGRVYFLRDREFLNGVTQVINQEDKDWLEEHAVDEVTVEGENEHQKRPKFVYEIAGNGGDETASPSPRARGR